MEKKEKKIDFWDRLVFILRYCFFGFLIWSYYNTAFFIVKKGTIGVIFGTFALILFVIFLQSINPRKTNNNEFGIHTDIIGVVISILFMLVLLFPIFGNGFNW